MLVYLQVIALPEQRDAFEQIYNAYRDLMYHVAYGVLHDRQDAEDAVHDAFIALAEHMEKIDEPVCPKTKGYVVTIVENKAIDLYRRKQRHPELPFEEETVGLTVEMESAGQLARCMARLNPRYRQALLLKFRYGYDTRELARLLNVTPANAAKLIQRARAQLDTLCGEEGLR